jgi:hypothetical protein
MLARPLPHFAGGIVDWRPLPGASLGNEIVLRILPLRAYNPGVDSQAPRTVRPKEGTIMLRSFRTSLVFLALASMLFSAAGVYAQSSPTTDAAAKTVQLLQASGYKFTEHSPVVWSIDRTGAKLKNFREILALGTGKNDEEPLLVIFVIVAKKAQMRMTPEFMQSLLHFNHTMDSVKVGIDDDGDLGVRIDTRVRLLDANEFKMLVEQVANASNEIYGESTSFISSN